MAQIAFSLSVVQEQTGTCFECGTEFELPGYDKDYCSADCRHQHKGEKAVNTLKHDHRLCATCGRWLKDIERPTEEWAETHASVFESVLDTGGELHNVESVGLALDATDAGGKRSTSVDAVIGYQYGTENAVTVEKERQIDDFRAQYSLGIGCVCGTTDPSESDEILQEIELATVLANYVTVFRALEREGQLDQRIDKDRFFRTYKESRDLEYSLGKALA